MNPRRLPYLAAAMSVVALAMPAGAATDDAVSIASADTSKAPDVTLTVSVAGSFASETLDGDAFRLLVSGEERAAKLTGLPTDPIQVELVIDTSGSMEGEPLAAAKSAAASLVEQLPDAAVVGVIGFGDTPYEVIAPTDNHGAAVRGIEALEARGGTAMYDGVALATGSLDLERRAVVLLTDGADSVSAATLESAAESLADSRATFYAVALATPETDLAAARTLTDAAGGTLVEGVTPAALESVYDAIAGALTRTYQLTFEATATGSTGIVVEVSSDGSSARAETRIDVPRAAAVGSAQPGSDASPTPRTETAPAPGLLQQSWVLWLAAITFFLALAIAGIVLVTRERMASQLAQRRIRRAGRGSPIQTLTEHATDVAVRSIDRSGRRGGIERALEHAGINMRAEEFMLLLTATTIAGFALGLLVGGLLLAISAAVAVVVAARLFTTMRTERRQAKFADQLEETLPLMAGSLRAGYGLMQALDAVAQESQAPTSEEFRRLVGEARLGRDLTDGLQAMSDRVGGEDFQWVVQAIDIHRQVGGDLAEVLDNVYATIRDRNRTRRQIQALSGEGKLSAMILFALPIGMFVFVSTVNPNYIEELTGNTLGIAMLVGGGVLMVLGGLWMRRIIRLVF